MIEPSPSKLWWQVALPFLLFVVAGSLGLVLVLDSAYQRRSTREFAQLAEANAEFIRTTHIPATDRFAEYLTRVLGVRVLFTRQPSVPATGEEVASARVEDDLRLVLARPATSLAATLQRPATLVALGVFWALSLALGWVITRNVVLPYLETQRRLVESERLALLGKMATGLAHEIHNPVAAIRLHAQLANHPVIVQEAANIEGLVNQWMFLAKPEPPQRQPVALDQLLRNVAEAQRPQAKHAGVELVVRLEPGMTVDADARRLAQVFHNIIVNAIQAMPGGGILTVTGRGQAIEFADTGPGFSPTALEKHAEMFYSEKEGGMGIGLSVATEVIQAHGGKLTVANQPTGGACVRIEL